MTERLYYTDAYRGDFEATVVDVADAGRRVYLDRTAFYPTSGGQPHDTGQLGGIKVIDVADEGDRIAHLLAEPLGGAGSAPGLIAGRIDWPRRFDHMQQHTGQHLLSGIFAKMFDYDTMSAHFGRTSSTIDLDAPSLTLEQAAVAEEQANIAVTENRPVAVTFEDAATVAGLRKPPARQGLLRIVTIDDVDRSACGGTHVRATGEIGSILLRNVERIRTLVRLEFLCGLRAVRQASAEHRLLTSLSALASAGVDELTAVFNKQRAELKQAEAARRALETKLDGHRARELYATAAPDADGIRRVVVRDDEASLESLRGLARMCLVMPSFVFVGVSRSVPGVIVAASDDAGVDAGAALKAALASAGGRGGGTARLAQGTVGNATRLDEVVRYLLKEGPGKEGSDSDSSVVSP